MTEQQIRAEFEKRACYEDDEIVKNEHGEYQAEAVENDYQFFEAGWLSSIEFLDEALATAFMVTSDNKTIFTTSLKEAHGITRKHGGKITCLYAPPAN